MAPPRLGAGTFIFLQDLPRVPPAGPRLPPPLSESQQFRPAALTNLGTAGSMPAATQTMSLFKVVVLPHRFPSTDIERQIISQAGGWSDTPKTRQWRLAGRTLGLVGLGNIGRAVARKLGGWDLRLLAVDPYVPAERAAELGVQLVDLPALCRESDYISLHAPLLPETRHMIGRRELASMKPGAVIINTARGPLLDETALAESLASGGVAAAGLDVFETEPLAPSSPLRQHPRVIVSDHAAWYSEDSLRELKKSVAEEAVRACTGGLPVAIANPEVLHKLGRFQEWTPNYNAQWRAKRAMLP